MSRGAVIIPFPRARRPKPGFSLTAICDEAEQVERRSSRLLAAYVATSLALLAALQLLAMH
jgi:hypothetical protein